jgi:WD40 repeat protein
MTFPVSFIIVLVGCLGLQLGSQAKPNVVEVATLPTPAPIVVFSLAQSGRIGAGICKDGLLRVWALPEGRLLRSVDPGTNQFLLASFSRDGKLLQTSTWSGNITVWDTATGREVSQLRIPHYSSAVAFSRDNRLLAVATSFGPVQIVELGGNRKRCELPAITGGTQAVAFSPDGTRIATADADTQVRVYDSQTGKLIASQEEFLMDALSIDFTADGKEVIAAGAEKRAVFFDATTGQVTKRLTKQANPVLYLEVSADGRSLATVLFNDKSASLPVPLLIWDAASGRKVDEWLPPSGVVGGAWTPEGHFIVATLTPEAVHIWQAH